MKASQSSHSLESTFDLASCNSCLHVLLNVVSLDLTSDLLRDSERYEWNPPLPLSGYMYPRTKTRAAFRNI